MGFAHDMWWGTYVKCMLCPCIFMFVLRSCSPFGWTAGRISILSIFRRRSPSPSMVRKAFVHYYRPTTFHYDIYITTRRRPISTYCIPYTRYAIEYVLSICYWAYHALSFAYIVDQLLRSWYATCYSLSSCDAAKRVLCIAHVLNHMQMQSKGGSCSYGFTNRCK